MISTSHYESGGEVSSRKYSFVTVYFEAEVLLLEVQARSFLRYVDKSLIEEIILVYNGHGNLPPMSEELKGIYGDLAPLVRIIPASALTRLPSASGWETQQILKLLVSKVVKATQYVVLDAKTHFISELKPSFLSSESGKARANVVSYRTNPQLYALKRALRFFFVSSAQSEHAIQKSLDSVTPFVFYRDLVWSMVSDLEGRSGKLFATTFIEEGFSEFTLYSVYLSDVISPRSLDHHYEFHQSYPAIIWGDCVDATCVQKQITQARTSGNPTFSAHRRSFVGFEVEAARLLGDFWVEREIMKTEGEARDFIARMSSLVGSSEELLERESRRLRSLRLRRRIFSRLRMLSSHALRIIRMPIIKKL